MLFTSHQPPIDLRILLKEAAKDHIALIAYLSQIGLYHTQCDTSRPLPRKAIHPRADARESDGLEMLRYRYLPGRLLARS